MGTKKYPGITKTARGYDLRITAVDSRTGKLVERRKSLPGATLEEAITQANDLRIEIRDGGRPKVKAAILGDYVQSWLVRRLPRLQSDLTKDRYVTALEKHILPHFGEWRIDAIDKMALEEWLVAKRPRKYSADTINGWWRIFKDVLQSAVVDLGLQYDPTIRVKPLPLQARKERNSLTPEELSKFLEIARVDWPQWYAMIVLGFAIGARPGELRPLRWGTDLDLAKGHLILQQSQRGKYLGPTKTKVAREVFLPPEVVAVLRWHRQRLIREGHPGAHSGLVFPSMGLHRVPVWGTPQVKADADSRTVWHRLYRRKKRAEKKATREHWFISHSALVKPFDDIAKKAKIQGRITQKAMRRTFNDLARLAEVNNLVTRSVTGHQTEEMQNTYSTVGAEEKRAGVAKVVALFGGKGIVP